ncbi:MAG: hypothetical protein F4Y16_14530 [Holophagales bacterium]|nr:hypothetical protein [Holophagales bacterium]MYH25734.1 hypothetical protein [Holophagales bacterium]
MSAPDSPPIPRSSHPRRPAVLLAASLLLLSFGGCDNRGDLLGVELVVFTLGEWAGTGPQGEEFRFILERDDDDVRLAAFLVNLPGLADAAVGESDACATLVNAFTSFGNSNANIRIREAGFRFRTPNDVRVDQDGLIEAVITGSFDSSESAMVDAEIEIDATRFLPCRIETMVSWQVEPVGS